MAIFCVKNTKIKEFFARFLLRFSGKTLHYGARII